MPLSRDTFVAAFALWALAGHGVARAFVEPPPSADAVAALREYLQAELADQPFAHAPLSRDDAATAEALLWASHVRRIRAERAAEMNARVLVVGDKQMPFDYEVFGDKPPEGRSLYISMHGGGGAPKQINDQQWENQKRLYRPEEGVYLSPRAPTDTWDLWHQSHIDPLFARLIENLIVFEEVDPNRVYLLGYSAGGDGVYQLAPRMADRLAAAAMMAGSPNEASPLGLRNLPFTIHVGGNDAAYGRNEVARKWGKELDDLRSADPQGYEHWVKIYEGKGHWLDREDAAALPWMARFVRNPLPHKIVWRQDDVTHGRSYWLAVDNDRRQAGDQATAELNERRVDLTATGVERLTVRFHDRLLDLDAPLSIVHEGRVVFEGQVPRTIATLAATLAERGDPRAVFSGEVSVDLPTK